MKKIFLCLFLQTVVVYSIFYVILTFIAWKFTNPFIWILDIPKKGPEYRTSILVGMGLYYGFSYIVWRGHLRSKKDL